MGATWTALRSSGARRRMMAVLAGVGLFCLALFEVALPDPAPLPDLYGACLTAPAALPYLERWPPAGFGATGHDWLKTARRSLDRAGFDALLEKLRPVLDRAVQASRGWSPFEGTPGFFALDDLTWLLAARGDRRAARGDAVGAVADWQAVHRIGCVLKGARVRPGHTALDLRLACFGSAIIHSGLVRVESLARDGLLPREQARMMWEDIEESGRRVRHLSDLIAEEGQRIRSIIEEYGRSGRWPAELAVRLRHLLPRSAAGRRDAAENLIRMTDRWYADRAHRSACGERLPEVEVPPRALPGEWRALLSRSAALEASLRWILFRTGARELPGNQRDCWAEYEYSISVREVCWAVIQGTALPIDPDAGR